jgi:hypothetical protein
VIFPEQRCWQSDSIGREKQIGLLELEHSSWAWKDLCPEIKLFLI